MKILPMANQYHYINKTENNISFSAYKHMGKSILSSGGIFVSAVAAAFLDAPQEDIVEISTVDNDSNLSKAAYDRLLDQITKHKNSNNATPVSREKYKTDYVPPQKEAISKPSYEEDKYINDYDYLTKRIYCYSDMM